MELIEGKKEWLEEETGIEVDEENEEGEINDIYPYSSEEIRIDQKMFSLFQIVTLIDNGKLILRPEFQRNFVWDKRKQSLLIESLMLQIPIPAFYFDENVDGTRTVIDGLQRLTTISRYVNGEFRLRGLQYLHECEGKTYEELEWKYKSRIDETQLAVNILDARCPEKVKFDVFRRINTGGIPLNAQEVRNIMANHNTRQLLLKMVSCSEFYQAMRGKVNDVRMSAQELCLRFIAYKTAYDTEQMMFRIFGDMTQLLDEMVIMLNQYDQEKLDSIFRAFTLSMQQCHMLFGDTAFSKPQNGNVINRALFTSFSILLCNKEYDFMWLEKKRERAQQLLKLYLDENKEYYNAITSSTSSKKNMEIQFYYAAKILEEL